MAIVKLTIDNQATFPHYFALSGDVKPTEGTRTGEYLQETDTRHVYQWDGDAWNRILIIVDVLTSDYEYKSLRLAEEANRFLKKLTEE